MILRAAGASGAAEFGKSFNGHCLCLQLGGCVLVQGQKTIRFIELFLHFSHGTQDMVSAPAAGRDHWPVWEHFLRHRPSMQTYLYSIYFINIPRIIFVPFSSFFTATTGPIFIDKWCTDFDN